MVGKIFSPDVVEVHGMRSLMPDTQLLNEGIGEVIAPVDSVVGRQVVAVGKGGH